MGVQVIKNYYFSPVIACCLFLILNIISGGTFAQVTTNEAFEHANRGISGGTDVKGGSILVADNLAANSRNVVNSSNLHFTSDADSGKTAVIVEAESGILGNSILVQQEGDITYVTTTKDYIGQTNPSDSSCIITYQVAFQDSGYYSLFARLRVGPATFDDDSFFYGSGFGVKNDSAETDWVFINGLASAGFSSPSDFVDGPGTVGSQTWKWINVSKNFYQGEPWAGSFYVGMDTLSKIFQIASREDGLSIDKFAFGKSDLYFTVEALDNELPGSTTGPEPDSIKSYPGPPLAEELPKFLGNVKSLSDNLFANYWNQLTPGNEVKWGSVATTVDTSRWNWSGLDALYNYAKQHNLIFKDHTLIWGNQQPSWIESLETAKQYEYIEAWIRMVGRRYPEMDMVDVVNEPLHDPPAGATNGNYIQALGGNGDTGWDWVINAFKLARKYLPDTQLLLNDYGIINDNSATTAYLTIIHLLQERELIDGIGVQGHRFALENASTTIVKGNLDRLAATGLPIYISEMDLGNLSNAGTPNDDQQLQLYQKIFPVLWEHPGVKGITLWGYIEGQMWQSTCYLVRRDGTWRPALEWLAAYIQDSVSGIENSVKALPADFRLEQNYPNPFNLKTHITFTITESAQISLKIYDMLGREVAVLVDENLPADDYTVAWDAENSGGALIGSGIYFYRLVAGNGNPVITKKMLLIK
jgi:endo-1,4-beta-xylanase